MLLKMSFQILLLLFCIVSVYCEIIELGTGLIKGKTETCRGGRKFYSFYGIPYAAPPIGKLRLKDPVEAEPWEGIRDCTQEPPKCPQPANWGVPFTNNVIGQEDCLFINVFTLHINKTESGLPVIVYIHGGGFQIGDGVEFGPHYLMNEDIVYVTFNYRLGSLGFLSLGKDSLITGNYALKDQNLALKWVQKNIAAFGGNPEDVTLMGESAGAACVHLHHFSPLSKGLFHKAVMDSGNAFSIWSYYEDADAKALGNSFVFVSGCFYHDPSKVLDCLQKLPAEDFVKKETTLHSWKTEPGILFRPTLESNVEGAFLPVVPNKNTYVSKNVPMLTGINSAEGIIRALPFFRGNAESCTDLDTRSEYLFPMAIQYKFTSDPSNLDEITRKVKNFYFGDKKIGFHTDTNLVDMFTDSFFAFSFIDTARQSSGTRYAYLYDHRANFSTQNFGKYPKDLGVSHADEIFLIASNPRVDGILTATDVEVSKRLVKYWTNFAKYGNPNGQGSKEEVWRPVTSDGVEYLHIRTESDTMKKDLWKKRIDFWKSLPLGKRFN